VSRMSAGQPDCGQPVAQGRKRSDHLRRPRSTRRVRRIRRRLRGDRQIEMEIGVHPLAVDQRRLDHGDLRGHARAARGSPAGQKAAPPPGRRVGAAGRSGAGPGYSPAKQDSGGGGGRRTCCRRRGHDRHAGSRCRGRCSTRALGGSGRRSRGCMPSAWRRRRLGGTELASHYARSPKAAGARRRCNGAQPPSRG